MRELGTVAGHRIVVWLELPVRQREPSASRAYSVATEATGSDCCSETWVLQTKYKVHQTGPRNAPVLSPLPGWLATVRCRAKDTVTARVAAESHLETDSID